MTNLAHSATVPSYRRGVLLVLLGSTCSSSIGLFVRIVEDATAWQLLFYRTLSLAAFLLIVIGLRYGWQLRRAFRGPPIAMAVCAVGLATAFCGIIFAIQISTVANAMFLLAAAPFMAAIFGWLLLKEYIRPVTWIAIVCAFLGIFVMVSEAVSFGHLWGNIAGLIAAVGFAVWAVSLRWGRLGDMLPAVFLAAVVGMIVAGMMCQITGTGIALDLHDTAFGLAMGVFQLGLALVFMTAGSRSVPAAEFVLLGMVEVVLAPVWVWLFLGETAGPLTLIGGALVLAAVAGDALSGARRRPSLCKRTR